MQTDVKWKSFIYLTTTIVMLSETKARALKRRFSKA